MKGNSGERRQLRDCVRLPGSPDTAAISDVHVIYPGAFAWLRSIYRANKALGTA